MRWTKQAAAALALAGAGIGSAMCAPPGVASPMRSPPELVSVTNIVSGQVIDHRAGAAAPESAGPALGGVVALDTMTNEGSAAGLNVAYVNPGSYSGANPSTQAFALGLAERLVYRAPMDQAEGIPLPTDILWNDYRCDLARWPGGVGGPPQALGAFGFIPYFQNTEPPLAPRTHTLRVQFFSLDRRTEHGGFEAEFRVSPGQTGYFDAVIDLDAFEPPIMAPASGWVMIDWIESNNSGVGCMFTGGDLANPAIPRPETLWDVGSADPLMWWFADGVTGASGPPEPVDPSFDGDPDGVSYLDVFNTGAMHNWVYTAGSPPEIFLAHDFAAKLVLRSGAPVCPCDVNDSGTLNSQDFFDFISAFFGGDADYNQSGETNSQDFFDFLGCFFGGC